MQGRVLVGWVGGLALAACSGGGGHIPGSASATGSIVGGGQTVSGTITSIVTPPKITAGAGAASTVASPTPTPTVTSTPAPAPGGAAGDAVLAITGAPATHVLAGSPYAFSPTVRAAAGVPLTFSIQNAPSWATFNSATGALGGTPGAANVGTYANITVRVSDGTGSAALAPFSIAVNASAGGSATLSWVPPSVNVDGTPVGTLAGYTIHYGNSADALTQTTQVANPGVLTYVVGDLAPGTWYFAVEAYTANGISSGLSAVGSASVL